MLPEQLVALGYIAMRLAPITLVAPAFFLTFIPFQIRVILTLALSIIIGSTLGVDDLISVGERFDLFLLLGEFSIGLALVFGFHVASASLHMMAQLIDIQVGISAGATFDPQNYQTNTPTSTLVSMVAVAVFFSTNIHYEFLQGLSEIFRLVPIGRVLVPTPDYLSFVAKAFVTAFILAGPVIIVLFLTDVALALISRSMPQVQVYFVALPLKIIIGFLMLAITLELSMPYFVRLLSATLSNWDHLRIR